MSWTGHLAVMHWSGVSTASDPPYKHCFVHALYYTYCSGERNTSYCLGTDNLSRQVALMYFVSQVHPILLCMLTQYTRSCTCLKNSWSEPWRPSTSRHMMPGG